MHLSRDFLKDTYIQSRNRTIHLCSKLQPEDYNLQGAEFTSPPKWHLAHTTWFFEEMILAKYAQAYQVFNSQYAFLFNSYYNTLGKRVPRNERGLLSRPYLQDVFNYRSYVDRYMTLFIETCESQEQMEIIYLGIQHEEQHQELLQTDIKYSLSLNPFNFLPIDTTSEESTSSHQESWIKMEAGMHEIGYAGNGFCYDNELCRHKVYLESFEISATLVKNLAYIEFIEAGGYSNFNYWLDDGWTWLQKENVKAPLYWKKENGQWMNFTMQGLTKINNDDILKHISYYEAMAFATWKGCRLPTEFEWEAASDHMNWGDRWEWTNSAYLPYPGFSIAEGAVGEYNGKFMANQMVLRGASEATAKDHSRNTYRNFFQPHLQWQYSGIRLAK